MAVKRHFSYHFGLVGSDTFSVEEVIDNLRWVMKDLFVGLVVSVVDPQPGETIVDCCAAPGGKTLFMASRLSGEGKKIEWTERFDFLMML
jgi:hypothetical protein